MKSSSVGTGTSAEVLNVSETGIWLLARGKEYFLPYEEFPWFRNARISEIHGVGLQRGHHLRWEELDVDLDLDSLKDPGRFPLKYA